VEVVRVLPTDYSHRDRGFVPFSMAVVFDICSFIRETVRQNSLLTEVKRLQLELPVFSASNTTVDTGITFFKISTAVYEHSSLRFS